MVVFCAALAAAFVVVLISGSPGTRYAASPGPRQVSPRSLTVYAEPQITYCTSIKRVSPKSLPTSFPTRGLAGCKRVSSSTNAG